MAINLKAAMVFDAICACSLLYDHVDYKNSAQNEVLTILKECTGEVFSRGAMSYSTVCGIVAMGLSDPATATLDDLYHVFASVDEVDRVVRARVKNEFKKSYIFPALDMLRGEWAERYCSYISALQAAQFEQLWQEHVLPHETAQIQKLEAAFGQLDTSVLTEEISALKGECCKDVTVYVSLLSYPVSFTLDESSFLDTVNTHESYYESGFLSMIAHELMHGFSTDALTTRYLNFVEQTPYLKATHRSLLEDMHSGDEEEMVMAAEYYILWKSGILNKEQIVLNNYGRYGGCVPLALYIFDYMTKETAPIGNYASWLLRCFSEGRFCAEDVMLHTESILPQPLEEVRFYANFFVRLQRCSYILRDAQLDREGDIKQEIEQMLSARFEVNEEREVQFANGMRTLGDEVQRQTLTCEGFVIERIEFSSKAEALSLTFPYRGSNVGVPRLVYEGKSYPNVYILNLAYPKDKPIQAEFSFVCGNTRYCITAACGENIVDIDTDMDPAATVRRYGQEILDTVKRAERIVMLMQ